MNKNSPQWPVYLPALVLISGLALTYIAGSGWQYAEKPWTLYLMLPAIAGMFASFVLMLFGNILSIIFLLFSVLLALPYFIPAYFRVLIEIVSGRTGYIFTGWVLSLVILLISFTVFKALHPKQIE
jgi:hypothetical protein